MSRRRENWAICNECCSYAVSDLGRFKRLAGSKYVSKDRILMPVADKDGYAIVSLWDNGLRLHIRLHRLVAKYFIPNVENKSCINHKDGNKFNNSAKNLEWCTRAENNKHAAENGLMPSGERHPGSILKNIDVLEIRRLVKDGLGVCLIAKLFGVAQPIISNIKSKVTWKHLKFQMLKQNKTVCNTAIDLFDRGCRIKIWKMESNPDNVVVKIYKNNSLFCSFLCSYFRVKDIHLRISGIVDSLIGEKNLPFGEHHHKSKLKEKDVVIIKRLLLEGMSPYFISKSFSVAYQSIAAIQRGQTWKHVK